MSMHKTPLTQLEEDGLRAHGLDIGSPSQLSDVFRHGIKWALEQTATQPEQSGFSPELLQRVMSALNQGASSFKSIKSVRDEFRASLSTQRGETK